jgi:hypothetical protein
MHLIFAGTTRFYSNYLFRFLSPIQSIKGKWFFIFGIETPPSGIRHGEAYMINELGSLSIHGVSYDEKNDFKSTFRSLATYLDHAQLLVFYQSEGHTRAENRVTNGMMELSYASKAGRFQRPKVLQGSWKDTVSKIRLGCLF